MTCVSVNSDQFMYILNVYTISFNLMYYTICFALPNDKMNFTPLGMSAILVFDPWAFCRGQKILHLCLFSMYSQLALLWCVTWQGLLYFIQYFDFTPRGGGHLGYGAISQNPRFVDNVITEFHIPRWKTKTMIYNDL